MLPAAAVTVTVSAIDVGDGEEPGSEQLWRADGNLSPTVAVVSVDLPMMRGDESRMKRELIV
uniref:Uncharacterized protein n=1 Tax=Oryza rufipogon TaxID=4529 RepID=A0A0E0Q6P0_ORYRU